MIEIDKPNNHEDMIKLNNGRTIGLAEYGAIHGKPVFYFHGFPGSRIEIAHYDEAAKFMGLRIISLDRPGMGLSSFDTQRTILSWVDDVVTVADKLNINKFSVLGHSGGAPFVVACAYKIPDRINSAVIVSGMAPLEELTTKKGSTVSQNLVANLIKFFPSITNLMMHMTKKMIANPEKLNKQLVKQLPDVDKVILQDNKIQKEIINSLQESFKNGTSGPAQEMRLLFNAWGFNLRKVETPLVIWHGNKDKQAPICHAMAYKELVQNSTLHILENQGHHSLIRNYSNKILNCFT